MKSVYTPSLNKNFVFENFVAGDSNEFSKNAAISIAESPGKTSFNPLFIYGDSGLGKTHLIHALANHTLSSHPYLKVCFFSSEEFHYNYIDSIKDDSKKSFSEKFNNCDLFIIDDVHFFSAKESTQEELFHIFNYLYNRNRQIVLTSDTHPSNMNTLHKRLTSRFQSGLIVKIEKPSFETRIAIIKKKCENQNIHINDDIINFMAENITESIRKLEGSICKIFAYSSINKEDISLGSVKKILSDTINHKSYNISINRIIEEVSDYFSINPESIMEKNRRKEVAFARQIAIYLSKKLTKYSLKAIGLHMGGRDHSTVIHAVNKIENLVKENSSCKNDVDYLCDKILKS